MKFNFNNPFKSKNKPEAPVVSTPVAEAAAPKPMTVEDVKNAHAELKGLVEERAALKKGGLEKKMELGAMGYAFDVKDQEKTAQLFSPETARLKEIKDRIAEIKQTYNIDVAGFTDRSQETNCNQFETKIKQYADIAEDMRKKYYYQTGGSYLEKPQYTPDQIREVKSGMDAMRDGIKLAEMYNAYLDVANKDMLAKIMPKTVFGQWPKQWLEKLESTERGSKEHMFRLMAQKKDGSDEKIYTITDIEKKQEEDKTRPFTNEWQELDPKSGLSFDYPSPGIMISLAKQYKFIDEFEQHAMSPAEMMKKIEELENRSELVKRSPEHKVYQARKDFNNGMLMDIDSKLRSLRESIDEYEKISKLRAELTA